MNWTNWLTLSLAVLGATLGVFNAVWMIRRDVVRLRVVYGTLVLPAHNQRMANVEVTNVGYLAVTITEVAIQKGLRPRDRAILQSDYLGRVNLPVRLEPRTSFSIAADPNDLHYAERNGYTHVRAVTACGVKVVAKIRWKRA